MENKVENIWEDFCGGLEEQAKTHGSKFRIEPVTSSIFFKDWLKTPLFPRQQRAVDKSFTADCRNISSTINELVLGWGKRSGKDLTIANLLCYLCYWLCCLKNPQEYLGIKSGEPIDIVNVAFDKEQAKSVFFEKFTRKLRDAINPVTQKNFFDEIGVNLDRAILRDSVEFPNNIRAWSLNSREYKAEGKNTVFAIFDEIGSFRFDKAQSIRKHIRTTARTTSLKFYKLFYISYLTSGNDYMAYLLDQEPDSKTYVDRAATWEVRSTKKCPKELLKYVVNKENYQDDFDEDPEGSMLMYECKVPKFRTHNLIKRADKILSCTNMDRPDPRVNKDLLWTYDISQEEFEPWFNPYTTWEIWSLEKEYEKNPSEEIAYKIKIEKERHQISEYFAHIDLSRGIVDCAGIALGHKYYILDKVKLYIDFMLQVRLDKLGSLKEIDMTKILQFIIDLKQKRRFPISKLTADGWQSSLFLQTCTKSGIDSEYLSLESKNEPYDTFKDFIYREDINLYYYAPFVREATELIITDKNKYDHPRQSQWRMKEEFINRGSKDITDCIAGICSSAMKDNNGERLSWSVK